MKKIFLLGVLLFTYICNGQTVKCFNRNTSQVIFQTADYSKNLDFTTNAKLLNNTLLITNFIKGDIVKKEYSIEYLGTMIDNNNFYDRYVVKEDDVEMGLLIVYDSLENPILMFLGGLNEKIIYNFIKGENTYLPTTF